MPNSRLPIENTNHGGDAWSRPGGYGDARGDARRHQPRSAPRLGVHRRDPLGGLGSVVMAVPSRRRALPGRNSGLFWPRDLGPSDPSRRRKGTVRGRRVRHRESRLGTPLERTASLLARRPGVRVLLGASKRTSSERVLPRALFVGPGRMTSPIIRRDLARRSRGLGGGLSFQAGARAGPAALGDVAGLLARPSGVPSEGVGTLRQLRASASPAALGRVAGLLARFPEVPSQRVGAFRELGAGVRQ